MISMALHDRIRKLTYDDYVRIPDDGQRHEIIDGEHYVTAAPFVPHQFLSVELSGRFRNYLQRRRIGRVLTAPTDVLLSKQDIVQPDLLFVSNERAGIIGRKNIQGAPDLLIEILSASNRNHDQVLKLDLYDRFDVLEYWIFDPDRRTVQAYRRTAEGLRLAVELSAVAGDVLTSPLLPGFSLPLAAVFEI
jgi:Uma2 family endonuclease